MKSPQQAVQFYFVWWLAVVGSGNCLLGRKCEQYLSFVADAGTNPEDKHDISEPALFRFLLKEETMKQLDEAGADIPEMPDVLKDLDRESKVTEFEIHQSSRLTESGKTDFEGAPHVFIVFKTTSETEGDGWWSLEKNNLECIVLQRSGNKDDVKNKLYGAERIKVEPIKEGLKGTHTIKVLFVLLWAHQTIEESLDIESDNCQAFVTLVSKQMTEIGYEYQGDFKCSPSPENNQKPQIVDLINYLARVTEEEPFFTSLYLENPKLVDKVIENAKEDIDVLREAIPFALKFAILFMKTKMMEILLKPPLSVDPTARDQYGWDALHMAVTHVTKTEMFDLLLAHPKVNVDDVDENGRTALHLAVLSSNVIAVQKLLENGANPNLFDNEGQSPLHVAATQRDGNPIIDLLLEAKKVKRMGGVNDQNELGVTALHYATYASNEITAEHLIQKGADLHIRDKNGDTPLHVALTYAKDMQIIELLLKNIKDEAIIRNDGTVFASASINEHGLDGKMVARLVEIAIASIKESKSTKSEREKLRSNTKRSPKTFEDENGMNLLHSASRYAKTTDVIDAVLETGEFNINGGDNDGLTPLHYAIMGYNPTINVPHLLLKGADPNVAENYGATPLHVAALLARDLNIVQLLLNHPDVDVHSVNAWGSTALEYAMKNENGLSEAIVNLLEEKGVGEKRFASIKESESGPEKLTPNTERSTETVEEEMGLNALHIAAFEARTTDEIDAVLNTGEFDINGVDNYGHTPLHYAIMGPNPTRNTAHLLQKGADPNIAEENGVTPLHMAASSTKDVHLVELLLNHPDVVVNRLDKAEQNELHYAMMNKHGLSDRIANLLKEKGAVEIENRQDAIRQALDRAIKDSDVEMVRTLIKNGFNISSMTWNKKTVNALHVASRYAKTTDLIDLILEAGEFDINGVDDEGLTPIHHALQGDNPEINVPHLIQRGADPRITEKKGVVTFGTSEKNAEPMDIFKQLLEDGTVELGYCDNPERYIFAPNVCLANSYIVYMNPPIYKKDE